MDDTADGEDRTLRVRTRQAGHVQEPGSDEDIASFCQLNHGVDFKLVKKSEVNGPKQNSVFAWLKQQEHGKGLMGTSVVKWNFEKFLVNRKGEVVGRWSSVTKPASLKEEIEKSLAQSA